MERERDDDDDERDDAELEVLEGSNDGDEDAWVEYVLSLCVDVFGSDPDQRRRRAYG